MGTLWNPPDDHPEWEAIEAACRMPLTAALRQELVALVNDFLFSRKLELNTGTSSQLIKHIKRLSRALDVAVEEIDDRGRDDPVEAGLVVQMRTMIEGRARARLGAFDWNLRLSPIVTLAWASRQFLAEGQDERRKQQGQATTWDSWVGSLATWLDRHSGDHIKVTSPVTAQLVLQLHYILEASTLKEFFIHAFSSQVTPEDAVTAALKRAQARLARSGDS